MCVKINCEYYRDSFKKLPNVNCESVLASTRSKCVKMPVSLKVKDTSLITTTYFKIINKYNIYV